MQVGDGVNEGGENMRKSSWQGIIIVLGVAGFVLPTQGLFWREIGMTAWSLAIVMSVAYKATQLTEG